MSFLSKLFGKSKEQDLSLRGLEPRQSANDQEEIRNRMEAEVLRSKAQRAAKAADADTAKDSTG